MHADENRPAFLHRAQRVGQADLLTGGRPAGDRQQRRGERHPPVRARAQELAVQRLGQGREGQRQSVLSDRNRQGQWARALCVSPAPVHGTAAGGNG